MNIQKPNKFKTFLSYIFPVPLYKKRLKTGPKLVIQLYKGQYQLGYGRVFYSDGHEYFPIKHPFEKIGIQKFKENDHFLCLGSGIGSLSQVLNYLHPGRHFNIDYVELNEDIIQLCQEVNQLIVPHISHQYFNADANYWLKANKKTYDYIIVDIFDEHIVPIFVFKRPFIDQLFSALNAEGYLVLNLMFQSEFQQHEFEIKFSEKFPIFDIISTRKNKIYIAQK